jgi:hypothetical protein
MRGAGGLPGCQQPWSQVVWGLQVYACDPGRRACAVGRRGVPPCNVTVPSSPQETTPEWLRRPITTLGVLHVAVLPSLLQRPHPMLHTLALIKCGLTMESAPRAPAPSGPLSGAATTCRPQCSKGNVTVQPYWKDKSVSLGRLHDCFACGQGCPHIAELKPCHM